MNKKIVLERIIKLHIEKSKSQETIMTNNYFNPDEHCYDPRAFYPDFQKMLDDLGVSLLDDLKNIFIDE